MHSVKTISILIFVTAFTGCAELMRHRTYVDEMENQDEGLFVAGQDFQTVAGDTGEAYRSGRDIVARTPASEIEMTQRVEHSSLIKELAEKEAALNPYQNALYTRAEDYLESPSEKIYFLNLSDEEKVEYLDSRSFKSYSSGRSQYGRGLASLQPVYSNTITMGMSKDDVVQLWGKPARVDIAGNPANQNERWAFYGNGGVRYIYFGSGRVEGWNLE